MIVLLVGLLVSTTITDGVGWLGKTSAQPQGTPSRSAASASPSPRESSPSPSPESASASETAPPPGSPESGEGAPGSAPGGGAPNPGGPFLAQAAGIPAFPMAPNNVFTVNVRGAPIAPNSSARLANLLSDLQTAGSIGLNHRWYNTSFLMVPAGTPRADVEWGSCPYAPDPSFFGAGGVFVGVPIPDNAVASLGSDGQMTIYDPANDQLWEFWRATKTSSGWTACWGGRIDGVSRSRGYFAAPQGASASSLISAAGTVTLAEARAGRIDHAIMMSLPKTAASFFTWPAQRHDGTDTRPNAIPEGARFRLNPNVDVESLPMSPFGKVIARAMQTYGIIVSDSSSGAVMAGESAQLAVQAGQGDPWAGIFNYERGEGGGNVLDGLPWDQMQFIVDGWGR